MLIIPYIINNIEIKENNIFSKTDKIEITDDNKLEAFNFISIDLTEELNQQEVIDILNNNSKIEIIAYIEIGFIFLLASLIIMIIILKNVEKLFNNIKNNHTPFTMDNVNYIKKTAYLMIVLILITPISGLLFNSIFGMSNENTGFELMNILEILIIFSMSYIFEYGYEIQKDSKGKIYGE